MRKTLAITWLCGIAHVVSSVALGLVGVALGLAVSRLEGLEELRGTIAAWMLIVFGLAYTIWGMFYASRRPAHHHAHRHAAHAASSHASPHAQRSGIPEHNTTNITPWVMFTIFLFGPCEPLIPLLMYPTATDNLWGLGIVTSVFLLATLATMTAMVVLLVGGSTLVQFSSLERYGQALAGGLVLMCGIGMVFGF
jgi:hypothetical protein